MWGRALAHRQGTCPRTVTGAQRLRSRACLRVVAFQGEVSSTASPQTPATPKALLLSSLEAGIRSKANVYGKPLRKHEREVALSTLAGLASNANILGPATALSQGHDRATVEGQLRSFLLAFLKEASETQAARLTVVEGAMALLEQMYLLNAWGEAGAEQAEPAGDTQALPVAHVSPSDMQSRWQLVMGADVGSLQYIPVVEELQVSPDGSTFSLDTDLGVLFTGFTGTCSWVSPGHLKYKVERVRLEARAPKAWERGAAWVRTRMANGGGTEAVEAVAQKLAELESANTCRPDPTCPSITIPVPAFPENELFIFASDGEVAVLRSRLGGLICLRNKTPSIRGVVA